MHNTLLDSQLAPKKQKIVKLTLRSTRNIEFLFLRDKIYLNVEPTDTN